MPLGPEGLGKQLQRGPVRIDKPRLLIVEGQDERRLLAQMLKHVGRDDVQVEDCMGKDAMPGVLANLPVRSGFANVVAVGVVRDADASSRSAFDSVSGALNGSSSI